MVGNKTNGGFVDMDSQQKKDIILSKIEEKMMVSKEYLDRMHELVKRCIAITEINQQLFKGCNELLDNNFNMWIRKRGGKVLAKCSTYIKEEQVDHEFSAQNFQELLVVFAKHMGEFLSGGSDLYEALTPTGIGAQYRDLIASSTAGHQEDMEKK